MGKRVDLQTLLEQTLGSRNVYFQPPESVRMQYPAIVYSRDDIEINHANDGFYTSITRYSVAVVTDNPDSDLVAKVAALPMCRFNRHYTSDNLYHDVFTLYF